MNIVMLEKASLGNDLDYSALEKEGNVTFYDYYEPELIIEQLKNADIAIVNKAKITEQVLKQLPNLKLICVSATGYNNIDIPATLKYNVVATNVKNYSTESVAQYVFAHLLAYYNKVIDFQKDIKNGLWQKSKIFTLLTHPIEELAGKTMGIIGYGHIGRRVADLAKAFGMNVLIAKRPGVEYSDNFRTDFDQVLRQSDVLSIHTPLTPQSKNLIRLEHLKMMKPTAVLINAARGGVVNEQDLYFALKNKIIAFAIVDVLEQEPPKQQHPFMELDNILLTPHIAWTSKQARQRLLNGIIENIRKFKQGKINEIRLTK